MWPITRGHRGVSFQQNLDVLSLDGALLPYTIDTIDTIEVKNRALLNDPIQQFLTNDETFKNVYGSNRSINNFLEGDPPPHHSISER